MKLQTLISKEIKLYLTKNPNTKIDKQTKKIILNICINIQAQFFASKLDITVKPCPPVSTQP